MSCCGANGKHLCDGEDDERQVSGNADSDDRFFAEPSYEVQIDEEIEGLEHHRDEHEAAGLHKMARD